MSRSAERYKSYKKALEEIRSLCIMHIGDKHELSTQIQETASKALKGSRRSNDNSNKY